MLLRHAKLSARKILGNSPPKKGNPEHENRIRDLWRCHPDLNWGIRVLQTHALPLGYGTVSLSEKKTRTFDKPKILVFEENGAGNEIRTRDIRLGKATLYH